MYNREEGHYQYPDRTALTAKPPTLKLNELIKSGAGMENTFELLHDCEDYGDNSDFDDDDDNYDRPQLHFYRHY